MFEALKTMLDDLTGHGGHRRSGITEERLATTALLVHMITVDGRALPSEHDTLRAALSRHFGINAQDAARLIEVARTREAEEGDLSGFVSVLRRSLDADGRARVIELMWTIATSDGVIHEFEDNAVWRVAEMLGVPAERQALLRAGIVGLPGSGPG